MNEKKLKKTVGLLTSSILSSLIAGFLLCFICLEDNEPIYIGMAVAFFIPFIAVVSYHLFDE